MSWDTRRLGEVITLQRGFDLPSQDRRAGEVPIVSSSGITGFHNVSRADGPGVVIGRYGTLGEVFYLDRPYWPLNTSLFVKDFRSNHPRYISYLLKTIDYSQQNVAGAVPGVNRNHLHQIQVRIPNLPVQSRIASVLSAYDDLIENNTRRIGVLEETVRSYWAGWLLTAQATSKPLGKLVSVVRTPVNPSTVEPTTPYLGLEHIPRRSFDLSEYGSAQSVTSTKIAFKTGDILFGKIRPYFHKVGPAPYDGITSSDTVVMRIHDSLDFAAVLLCVSSDLFVAEINQKANGAKMPRASWSDMSAYQVVCGAQADRVLLNDVVLPRIELMQNLGRRNRALRAARDLLLPKLLSGELSVDRIPDPAAVAP